MALIGGATRPGKGTRDKDRDWQRELEEEEEDSVDTIAERLENEEDKNWNMEKWIL